MIWFVLGEICGLLTAAITFGFLDRFLSWKKERKKKKKG